MIHPILTLFDEAEITASKPDANNNIKVYVEWVNKDEFESITFLIDIDKKLNIIKKETNDENKINHYTKMIEKMKEDIVEYVEEYDIIKDSDRV
jgi:hypothetical protein